MVELTKEQEKFAIGRTFLIGLAFFTTGIAWSMYNTQVNIMLFIFLGSYALVGALMAMDNLIGICIQPIMGNVSDRTRSKLGRRIPYLIIGIPFAAIFFILIGTIPSMPQTMQTFWLLIIYMFFFNVSMGFYRSQAVALMPDFIVPKHRSKGNAIINLMGGVGAIMAYIMGWILIIEGHPETIALAFLLVAVIMVFSLIILLFTVKEKKSYSYQLILEIEAKEGQKIIDKNKKPGLIESFRDILSEKDKSTLFMLLAIFFWFVAYQALEALFTLYAWEVLGIDRGPAAGMLLFVALPFIIMAFPAGILGSKLGRRITIKIGLIMFIIACFIIFITPVYFHDLVTISMIIIICFIIAGCGWAFININSIVIIWEMAPTAEKIGTYTGVYYFFSFLAAILGPFIVGLFIDLTTSAWLFFICSWFFIVAFILMWLVRRGEVELTEEEKIAKQKAIQEL
ncbi:MAG: MFS transporter [Promethearchaeota archaeon]